MEHRARRSLFSLLFPTLAGLAFLLFVPIVSMLRMEVYHRQFADDIDPLQRRLRHTIELAYKLRSNELYYLYSLDENHHAQFLIQEQEWRKLVAAPPQMYRPDPTLNSYWNTGISDLDEWRLHYAVESFKTGAQSNAPGGGDVFTRGINALERAILQAEKLEASVRASARETWQTSLLAETGVGVVCLLLGLSAWRTARALQSALVISSDNADRLTVAVRETNHRVKNNLQTIGALIEMHRHEHGESVPSRVLDEVSQQVRTVAAVHDFLSHEHRNDRVNAQPMLRRLADLASGSAAFSTGVRAEEAMLPVKEATSLALITNELVLNSGKHGAKRAEIEFCRVADNYVLRVIDDGPGFPVDFSVEMYANIGLNLVETLTRHDLRGTACWSNHDHTGGAHVEITFPILH